MLKFDMPEDVKAHILKIQGEIKSQKGLGKYSQQKALIVIVREHRDLKPKSKQAS